MQLSIKKIILWPKDSSLKRKEINFEPNRINVIVGDSQTGKSAIIPIIDYCLGSGKCSIPVGPIRDYTEWFGVLFQLKENQEILLARREPREQKQTSDMYFLNSEQILVPESIEVKNTDSNYIVNFLNQLSFLPSLDFAEDESAKKVYESKPSIKDFLAFCFQPQHIIANPYTLFYKADTVEHRFKLQIIFPLALGIINNQTLELEKELKLLQDEIRQKELELERRKKIIDGWGGEIKATYIQAIELGVLADAPLPDESWTINKYMEYLRAIPDAFKDEYVPLINEGTTNRILNYIQELQLRENAILDEIELRTIELSQIKKFNSTSYKYEDSLKTQQDRLEIINTGWLQQKLINSSKCPICQSDNHEAKAEISALSDIAKVIAEKSAKIVNSHNLLDKEVSVLEKQINELENQLKRIRNEYESLNRRNTEIQQRKKTIENTYKFIGRIEHYIKDLKKITDNSELSIQIAEITDKIKILATQISKTNRKQIQIDTLRRISENINKYKEILKVENYKNPTALDIEELTLKISSKTGRLDYLWEIGSGSNWMGYHIATILSLHEYFNTLVFSHTPSFVVFDQPSQAYFPDTIKDDETKQSGLNSDDFERVKSIFLAMDKFLADSEKPTQLIVLEHANKDFWGDIKSTYYVSGKRWLKNDALIPIEWIKE